ncbi:MAG TPA: sulfite exporter TauE/SafE family protein [Acidimicrobiales bacterium]|nr:sulfite exporter TauE/SafE family protein [Acidimicrobiales bacterium]
MHLSAAELAVALAAVFAGAFVQGSVGFGVNILAAPVMALVEPDALPAVLILAALPLATGMLVREHSHIDRDGLRWLLVGRLPGTALGALVVATLPADDLAAVIGALVLVAVGMSVAAPPLAVTRSTALAVGALSGAMGTASSIGGPPPALLYQHHPGAVLRSTTAALFVVGTILSASALAVAGEVTVDDVVLAAVLTPAIAGGLGLSHVLAGHIDAGWLRPAVLVVAAVAGLATMLRGLL